MDNYLVLRLTNLAIEFDREGRRVSAALIMEAIKEIENGRLVRGSVDEGADKSRDADKRTGSGGSNYVLHYIGPASGQAGRERGDADETVQGA